MENNTNPYMIEEATAVYNTHAQGAFYMTSKLFIQFTGLEAATLLADLISKDFYFAKKTKTNYDGWFFNTMENIKKHTTLSRAKQDTAIKKLEKLGILHTKRKGLPAKKYFKVNHALINELEKTDLERVIQMNDNDIEQYIIGVQTRVLEISKQGCLKLTNINNNKVNNNKLEAANAALLIAAEKTKKENKLFIGEYVQSNEFDVFWALYPNKGGKGAALTAWLKLCTNKAKSTLRPTFRTIRIAVRKQKQTGRWKDPKYIPLASTWLNQFRWLDDVNEMGIRKTNGKLNKTGFVGEPIKYKEPILM